MIGAKIPLFRLFGFQVNIDFSWFLLAVLITWSLAAGLFPGLYQGFDATTYWIMGIAGALGLFISIILHELGHALIARRCGMQMGGITLFIFGGAAEMNDEPPGPIAELLIAIAGPIVSLLLGVLALLVAMLETTLALSPPVAGVIAYLGWVNALLVVFNCIPAFPLDGGRVLRAILWRRRGDLRWATKITADIGGAFGIVLITLGVLSALLGNLIGGVWWFLLGMFLRGAARMSYRQVVFRRALEGEWVSHFMRPDPVTVSPELPIRDLVEDVLYTHQYKLYPVVDTRGDLHGCVTLDAVKDLPREQWDDNRVEDILMPCSDANTIEPDADAMDALTRLNTNDITRLMVVKDGTLVGMLALRDLLGFLSMKIDLEGE